MVLSLNSANSQPQTYPTGEPRSDDFIGGATVKNRVPATLER